ncbi:hypothetical protein LB542_20430 [Mesorhizobium sp. BR1-1-9]|uniref:nucleotide-binding domain containing protein n=1 Tax=unclassified Mesorhizobium TaxID=325217 RepID=UPI001CD06E86|nr:MULTISPECIES: nucleotide-binding domain containing protein [unclassified Mesorhizobium]MBZ9873213.1 hypothetical protein [Mesorhizobium sp. BR1-1-9]MBZ9944976.1 hypothetical protein [Mesorhizobium sp. BR1-1-13]
MAGRRCRGAQGHVARERHIGGRRRSGAVASAFGAAALEVGTEIDTGVPVLIFDGKPRLAFALKSGNFGADDFFERALDTLKGRAS